MHTVVCDFRQVELRIFASRDQAQAWLNTVCQADTISELGNGNVDFYVSGSKKVAYRLKPASFDDLFPRCRRDHGHVIAEAALL